MAVAARTRTLETIAMPTRFDVSTLTEIVSELRVVAGTDYEPLESKEVGTSTATLGFGGDPIAETEVEPDKREQPYAPPAEDVLDGELLSYRSLPQGWDGYDGVPASIEAVDDALSALKMRPTDFPLPYPQLASDGEVGLYWRSEEVYAELGFYGDGEFSFFTRYGPEGGEPVEEGDDRCRLDAEWPEPLLLLLNKLPR